MSKNYSFLKKNLKDKGWLDLLDPILKSKGMDSLINYIKKRSKKIEIHPKSENMFRAFNKCPLENTRVVILGMDPYPDGSGTGLAFANKEKGLENFGKDFFTPFSPSLQKIEKCIYNTVNEYERYMFFDYTLELWAKQGILLLNSALTVEHGKIGSHSKYWYPFTKNLITKLSKEKPGLIYLLWGKRAQDFKKFINKDNNYILEYHHPAYAARNNIDWDCPHFNEVNKIITEQNGKEYKIKW